MVMLFQVMALVFSTGNPSFAEESYSKYRELYRWQPQVLQVFLSLETNQQAELPTRTHSFLTKVLILKIHKSLLLFALCRQCNCSCKRALIPAGPSWCSNAAGTKRIYRRCKLNFLLLTRLNML